MMLQAEREENQQRIRDLDARLQMRDREARQRDQMFRDLEAKLKGT